MRRSIGRKLAATVAGAVLLSGVVTTAVTVQGEIGRYVASRRDNLLAAGRAFAAAASPAMAARDETAVFDALRGIGGVPHLIQATARDGNGRVLAESGFGAQLDRDPVLGDDTPSTWSVLRSRTLAVSVPVTDAGREVGTLELLSDAGDIWGGLIGTVEASLLGCGAALAAGLAIAAALQHSITRPLRRLTAAMAQVRDAHDYSVSIPRAGDDEVGVMVAGFNAMLADIRERDALLVRHRDRLEDDVRERTHDLAVAKEGAERANAAKSTFLATMSHEIRTPMTGLLVMAELLASGDLPARSRRYAEVIARSGTALLAIINDILDFSKIEAGMLSVERVPVDVRDVVGTVVALFQAKAGEKAVDLAAHSATDVPASFAGDPVRLQQIVGNLVNNALKFTETGSVFVEVAMQPGRRIAISVTDTGIGIPADKLDAIFEAFAQADGTTTRRFGGTGLGLSIAARLTKAMGGALTVESTLGAGSRFTCTLPVADATAPPPWPRLPRTRSARAVVALAGAGTRQTFVRMLEAAGYDARGDDPSGAPPDDAAPDLLVIDRAGWATVRRPETHGIVIAVTEPGETLPDTGLARPDAILKRPVLEREFEALLALIVRGERPNEAEADGEAAARPAFAGARVLVVDDTAVNREVMVEALRQFGLVPELAGDGFEALRAVASRRYDLVFMDGSMPGLDGFEACRRMRAAEAGAGRPRVPVIALTAHVVGEAAGAWREAGMDGVLHKPFTLAELERRLSAWLAPASADASAMSDTPLSGASDALFDPSVIEGLSGLSPRGSDGFAVRVLGLYRVHTPDTLAQIRAAAERGALDDLAASAHALRSMSVNVGARRASRLASEVEAAARNGQVATDHIASLEADLAATLAAIEAWRETAGGEPGRDDSLSRRSVA